jgi:hypothetical protein
MKFNLFIIKIYLYMDNCKMYTVFLAAPAADGTTRKMSVTSSLIARAPNVSRSPHLPADMT